MSWFLKAVRQYADFSGRAQRKEYWLFVLVYVLLYIGLSFVDVVLGTYGSSTGFGLLTGILALALLIPSVAVTVRRLHDTGRSGWWVLMAFIPLANIVLLVLCCFDSSPGANRYGPNPKEGTSTGSTVLPPTAKA